MASEFKEKLARFKLIVTSKLGLFVFGLLLGSSLTFVATNYSADLVNQFLGAESIDQPAPIDYKLPPIELPENQLIQNRIKYYLRAGAQVDLLGSYERSGQYWPMITAILEEYNLPKHLVYLPILESRFLPQSRSRVGAVGLWQLMPATASEYGLKYNRWVDERRDPEKSSVVAAEYLRYLYERFKNWELALAAYNCGPSQLRRIMRQEKTSNFWKLRRLPRETRNFVPNFYAILHILSQPEKYGVTLPDLNKPLDYETIDIEATFSVEQIARLANVTPRTIKQYNPALLGNLAPSGVYPIRVPLGVKEQFLDRYEKSPMDRVEVTYTTHRIRRGETLSKIARKYGTSVREIMADNNLRSSRWIKAGMKLRIASVTVHKASDPDSTLREISVEDSTSETGKLKFVYKVERNGLALSTLARYYFVSSAQIKAWNPWLQSDRLQLGEELVIYKSLENIAGHKTRRGDSLWKLARRYKTSVRNLKRWNQLTSSRIYPGQSLIVNLKR